jgi:hypothetical protein
MLVRPRTGLSTEMLNHVASIQITHSQTVAKFGYTSWTILRILVDGLCATAEEAMSSSAADRAVPSTLTLVRAVEDLLTVAPVELALTETMGGLL